MRVGATGPAVGGGFIPRDQYADGMSLYGYGGNSPVNTVDPDGRRPIRSASRVDEVVTSLDRLRQREYPEGVPPTAPEGYDPDSLRLATDVFTDLIPAERLCDQAIAALPWRWVYNSTCDSQAKQNGEYVGVEVGAGAEGYIPCPKLPVGAGFGFGMQAVMFCSTCEVCCFTFGKVKAGVGAGGAAGVSGTFLHGSGAPSPADYEGYFHGPEVSAGYVVVGGAWGDKPKNVEGGGQVPVGQALSVGGKREYFRLIKCKGIFER